MIWALGLSIVGVRMVYDVGFGGLGLGWGSASRFLV